MGQHLRFDELYDAARDRGMATELLVGPDIKGDKGKEHRDLVAVRVTLDKRTLVSRAITQQTSLDAAAASALPVIQAWGRTA